MSVREQGLSEAQPEWPAQQPSGAERQSASDEDVLEKLRKAVVDSASDARRAFVIFAAFSIYLAITVSSTTHQQLLIGTVFRLPILSVSIPILGFYIILPLLYLVAHFNLLGELNALSDDAYRLKRHLRETGQRLQAPIPFGLARTLVQPDDTGLPPGLIYFLAFIVIVLVPPLILLQIQLRFLPYHEQDVTWLHRGMILIDILLIMSLWFKFRHEGLRNGTLPGAAPEQSKPAWLGWPRRVAGEIDWAYRNTADAFICTVIFSMLFGFSLLVATVPDSWMERKTIAHLGWLGITRTGPGEEETTYLGHRSEARRQMLSLTYYFFESPESRRWIRRNLIVSHSDLVIRRPPDNLLLIHRNDLARLKEIWDQGVRGIDLRGRNLRHAEFSHSDLRKADLRGADLTGAVLFKANLQFADLGDIESAKIGSCPSPHWFHDKKKTIRDVAMHFCRSNLKSANFQNADLRRARLWEADLRLSNVSWAALQQADVSHAHLGGANMSGVNLADARLSQDGACIAFRRGARFKEKANDGTDDENDDYKRAMKISCVSPFEF